MEGDAIDINPNLELAQYKFQLSLPDTVSSDKDGAKKKLLEAIGKDNMYPFYQQLVAENRIEEDKAFSQKLKEANEATITTLDAKIKDAEDNLGENELREALLAKADFFTRIGDKEKAEVQYRKTMDKTVALGQKLDILFTLIRLGLFYKDNSLITRNLEQAKSMVEEGGDWDRRNRLKTYESLYAMSIRDFKKAADIFLDTLATFTSYELLPYNSYIFYLVLVSLFAHDRVKLKTKVIDSPDILSVIHEIPHLNDFLSSLYSSDYSRFFSSLASITSLLSSDRYLAEHVAYYCREMRIKAYAQLLESYSSVKLSSMASHFGVTVDFIDSELSRFVAAGRLHCKIDKVNGIVETTRPDARNAQYQATIKHGDLLLNRIQKLSRVINV